MARPHTPPADQASPMLSGLTPAQFMRRHWQKKPLLIRNAFAEFKPLLDRAALFELAQQEGVESRVIELVKGRWKMARGPVASLPPTQRKAWTMLVQGVDLHVSAAHELLQRFRFVPDARLDDLMVSWASDGGGVGPHFDSYDVFLLQASGQRRWRIGRQKDLSLVPDAPLKILQRFEAEQEWVLNPGDMLYLPPRWAHDGVAVGECMTYSIGFRAPSQLELVREVLTRWVEAIEQDDALRERAATLYADPQQTATQEPGRLPQALVEYAIESIAKNVLNTPTYSIKSQKSVRRSASKAVGEALSEPKPQVWFEASSAARAVKVLRGRCAVRLHRATRMLYDDTHLFVNGESWRAGGADARLMRTLANRRSLSAAEVAAASEAARELLTQWCEDGWLETL